MKTARNCDEVVDTLCRAPGGEAVISLVWAVGGERRRLILTQHEKWSIGRMNQGMVMAEEEEAVGDNL